MPVDKNMPILIVDDSGSILKFMRELLVQFGFTNIDRANDGATALSMLHMHIQRYSLGYSLIIADFEMDSMTGLQLLRKVRANSELKDTPFIMLIADSENRIENMLEAKEAGVSNYIVKPFDAATLRSKMKSVIGSF